MLDELAVHNLGILEDTRLDVGPGLIVVTGETGAGKTMLLGALRLLSGERSASELIGPFDDEARVEGRFIIGGEELVVSRKVGTARSRSYIDGTMVSVRHLAERTESLIEIVGQHDQLRITRRETIRALVDSHVDHVHLRTYESAWSRLEALRADLDALGGDRRALERERDLLDYQVGEITGAGFAPGEDTVLLQRARRLAHAEELAQHLAGALHSVETALDAAGEALDHLRAATSLDPSLGELSQTGEEVVAALSELRTDTRRESENIERGPSELENTERRLALLGDLRRKYGDTLEAVLAYGAEAARRRDRLQTLLERAETLGRDVEEAHAAVIETGTVLRRARQKAAAVLTSRTAEHLIELGFTTPTLRITVSESPASPHGCDTIGILFSSDERLEPGPVSKVASGGELSRLVLALRLASGVGKTPIIAFDEIDAGVGGETALALGRKLAHLSEGRQVFCVTHLPQVAAFADQHVVVERDGVEATVRTVEGAERLRELSRMLAGLPSSVRGMDHAEELIAAARAQR